MTQKLWLGLLLTLFLALSNAVAADPERVSADASKVCEETPTPFPYLANRPAKKAWRGHSARQTNAKELWDRAGLAQCSCETACDATWIQEGSCRARGGCDSASLRKKKRCGSSIFFSAEYMNWWGSASPVPTLLARGDGLPPNSSLFGGQIGDEYQSGLRLTGGFWLDDCRSSALVLRGYGSGGIVTETSIGSFGSPAFAVPFINDSSNPVLNGQPDSLILAEPGILIPGQAAGAIARARNDVVGADLIFRRRVCGDCCYRVDLLGGYQYANIDDQVSLATTTNRDNLGVTLETYDAFDCDNQFHAGQLGMIVELYRGITTLRITNKIGLGNMNQQVSIRGLNSVDGFVSGGGIFAQNQSAAGGPNFNMGDFGRDKFAVSPEVNVQGIVCLCSGLNLTLGYTFLYWSDVVLAGNHIDTRVNRDVLFDGPYIPGGGDSPTFAFNSTDYWVHSFDIGLSWQY